MEVPSAPAPIGGADSERFGVLFARKEIDPRGRSELGILIPDLLAAAPQTNGFVVGDLDHRIDREENQQKDNQRPEHSRRIIEKITEGIFQRVHDPPPTLTRGSTSA